MANRQSRWVLCAHPEKGRCRGRLAPVTSVSAAHNGARWHAKEKKRIGYETPAEAVFWGPIGQMPKKDQTRRLRRGFPLFFFFLRQLSEFLFFFREEMRTFLAVSALSPLSFLGGCARTLFLGLPCVRRWAVACFGCVRACARRKSTSSAHRDKVRGVKGKKDALAHNRTHARTRTASTKDERRARARQKPAGAESREKEREKKVEKRSCSCAEAAADKKMPSSPSATPPPLLLYIRHGDDHHDSRREARYPKHDHPLNREGKARAARMARNLVERYGAPTAVYCSPFKRARQTANIMMDALDDSDRARVTIDPGLSRYFSRREQRRPSVGSDTHEAGPPPIRERNGEFGRRCRRQYKRVVARHFFKANGDTVERPRGERPVVWCITHALVMRRVAERIGVVVPDDHVPFLGWFVARPRTSRPAMRGLSDHGLGRECPERALMAARDVGGARRRQRRRKHDLKNDNDVDGGRERKSRRSDRTGGNPKRRVADAKDHKQDKEARRDRRRRTKRPRMHLCLEEKAKRRPRAPATGT